MGETPRPRRPKPPAHLSEDAAKWFRTVVKDYDLEPHHVHLLQSAAEAWDRMQQARTELAAHGGITFRAASGDIKAHPAVAIERDARIAFARVIREIDLDGGGGDRLRPPGLPSNRR